MKATKSRNTKYEKCEKKAMTSVKQPMCQNEQWQIPRKKVMEYRSTLKDQVDHLVLMMTQNIDHTVKCR